MTWEIVNDKGKPIEKNKSVQEVAHDKLFEDLDKTISKAAEDLDLAHILHVG